MKKSILLLVLSTLSFVGYAREDDVEEQELLGRIEWSHAEGQKLYSHAMEMQKNQITTQRTSKRKTPSDGANKIKQKEVENNSSVFRSYLDGALRCFELERGYRSDLQWHRVIAMLSCDCDYDDDDYSNLFDALRASICHKKP